MVEFSHRGSWHNKFHEVSSQNCISIWVGGWTCAVGDVVQYTFHEVSSSNMQPLGWVVGRILHHLACIIWSLQNSGSPYPLYSGTFKCGHIWDQWQTVSRLCHLDQPTSNLWFLLLGICMQWHLYLAIFHHYCPLLIPLFWYPSQPLRIPPYSHPMAIMQAFNWLAVAYIEDSCVLF